MKQASLQLPKVSQKLWGLDLKKRPRNSWEKCNLQRGKVWQNESSFTSYTTVPVRWESYPNTIIPVISQTSTRNIQIYKHSIMQYPGKTISRKKNFASAKSIWWAKSPFQPSRNPCPARSKASILWPGNPRMAAVPTRPQNSSQRVFLRLPMLKKYEPLGNCMCL